jgi:hypothetical protein
VATVCTTGSGGRPDSRGPRDVSTDRVTGTEAIRTVIGDVAKARSHAKLHYLAGAFLK